MCAQSCQTRACGVVVCALLASGGLREEASCGSRESGCLVAEGAVPTGHELSGEAAEELRRTGQGGQQEGVSGAPELGESV